ncbi:MAG: hypothetical protein A2V66_10050 [Ignavibacteria bacterium RBG_13_36_8]|nr:MAG: hypothetical protein A2V66_10050 [Ignavibacteria bacterium RBG_13_36_8]
MNRAIFAGIFLSLIFFYCDFSRAQEEISFNDAKQAMLNGDYKEAASVLNKLLDSDSTDYKILYNLGLVYQQLFQYEKARGVLYKAYESEKFDIPLLLALGRNYEFLGASNYAVMFFEQAYELNREDANILMALGNAYMNGASYKKVSEIFFELMKNDSTNSYIFKQLAFCNYKFGEEGRAIELYRRAQKLNEYDATVPIQLGNLLVKREDYENAFYVVQEGLSENGMNIHLNRLAAEILFKLKRYQAARLQYERLIEEGDTTAAQFQRLGLCYYMVATDPNHKDY